MPMVHDCHSCWTGETRATRRTATVIDFSAVIGLAVMALTGGIGFFTSWSPRLRRLRLWRWVLSGLGGVLLMLPLSALLGSNTLAWMAGLSLMFLLPVLLIFCIGVVLGHWLATKDMADFAPATAWSTLRTGFEALRQRADLLLIVAGVGAGFAVVIGTGFRLNGDATPVAVSIAYVPAIADSRRWKEERQRFLAQLALDPVRRPYLALIERGEHWSADRIDYDRSAEDPPSA